MSNVFVTKHPRSKIWHLFDGNLSKTAYNLVNWAANEMTNFGFIVMRKADQSVEWYDFVHGNFCELSLAFFFMVISSFLRIWVKILLLNSLYSQFFIPSLLLAISLPNIHFWVLTTIVVGSRFRWSSFFNALWPWVGSSWVGQNRKSPQLQGSHNTPFIKLLLLWYWGWKIPRLLFLIPITLVLQG